ncbi:MAG: hypothetical protein RL685_628 [Pseudomonadota bacterium]
MLRATPTYDAPGDWFVQGQGEVVLLGATPATWRCISMLGLRPTGILDFGIIKAKIAGDYVKESPREQQAGLNG